MIFFSPPTWSSEGPNKDPSLCQLIWRELRKDSSRDTEHSSWSREPSTKDTLPIYIYKDIYKDTLPIYNYKDYYLQEISFVDTFLLKDEKNKI